MRVRIFSVFAALLLIPHLALASDVGPQGDGNVYGGSPYRLQCHGNGNNLSFLYGMSGMIGSWIDRVGGECADWVPGQGFSTAWNARSHTGTTGNSSGGQQQSAICPPGTIVKGFGYGVAVPNATFMQNIKLYCVDPLSPNAPRPERPELRSDNGNSQYYGGSLGGLRQVMCPGSEIATGVQGTSGDFVDSVGLICSAPPQTAAPANTHISGRDVSRIAGQMSSGGGSASGSGTPATPTTLYGFPGNWLVQSSDGRTYSMTLWMSGADVVGTYAPLQGVVSGGVISGTALTFDILQLDPVTGKLKIGGKGNFHLTGKNSMSGTWSLGPIGGSWTATRQ